MQQTRALTSDKWPPVYQFRFRAGPYHSPSVSLGTIIHDEYLGDVKVAGMTAARIPWPGSKYNRGRHDELLPILTGDLVRAICEEDELTVAHYWGITRYIVNQWKRAVAGVDDSNQVAFQLALKRVNPKFRAQFGYR